MDMAVHWGVWRSLRTEIGARGWVLLTALTFDAIVLIAFATLKLQSDPMILIYATTGILLVVAYERLYLGAWFADGESQSSDTKRHSHH